MSENHAFASLSPRLLARKGGAKPAMRRPDALRLAGTGPTDDLGWNDWGQNLDHRADHDNVRASTPEAMPEREMPQVLRQIEQLAWRINQVVAPASAATPDARRAAFTLRLDAERHFRLKMAGVVLNRSAQVLVTEALDKYLSEIPEVAHLRSAAGKKS